MSEGGLWKIPRGRGPSAALALFLAALTVAALGRIVGNGFIDYDDGEYVVDNLRVLDGLSLAGARWAFASFDNCNWHPLTWISHMADASLYGAVAWGHHLTSLLLHALSTALLFLVLSRMTGARFRSALVAALFAVHPLHVQSVAWVAERKDVLSGLFWFLAMGAYLRFARAPRGVRLLPVAALLALGLMAKAMLVTLPLMLVLLDFWPLGRIDRRAWKRDLRLRLLEKIPLLALALAGGALAFAAQRRCAALASLEAFPIDTRVWNALLSYLRYIGKTLLPFGLSVHYPHAGKNLPASVGMASLLALAVLTALAGLSTPRRGYPLVGWLWYLLTLLPVIGLFQIGPQAMADRYTYLPLVGLFILFAWSAADAAAGRLPQPLVTGCTLAVPLLLAALTWREAGFWKDSLALVAHSEAATPRNSVLLTIKGISLSRAGRLDEAIPLLRAAVELEPKGPYARYNLANALARAGKVAEAVEQYRISLENNPGDAGAHLTLGTLLSGLGNGAEALENLRAAEVLAPDYHLTHRELSRALERLGRIQEALAHARRAVALAPNDPLDRVRLGTVLRSLGRDEEATAHLLEALRLDPLNREAQIELIRARAAPPLDK